MFAAIWGSPIVIDGKVYLGNEDGDVVIAISNSGETPEVCAFVELVQPGAVVIAISGCGGGSRLAKLADISIDAGVERECDPNDLAPTASTTVSRSATQRSNEMSSTSRSEPSMRVARLSANRACRR